MTEQQIKDGFDRLEAGVTPPVDALVRVERRMVSRRRRRRTSLAGGGALALLVAAGLVVSAVSGDDGAGAQVATDPGTGPTSTLAMTRPDGSTVSFPDVTVSCRPPVTDAGDPISTAAGRIWMYSPIRVTGSEDADDIDLRAPFVYFEGTVDRIQGDRTFTLPDDSGRATEDLPMILFAADPRGPHHNEVSSQEGDSSGTVRVLEASCDPTPMLRLEVDATLGSEVEGPPVQLDGIVDGARSPSSP
ncbi:hypothetical protein GON03_13925 [Nocardioides sp. MAH-18]|uniref:Uncharacterized protein n=1 Tax=Nocardioides agri TaxID=2682843 RepID=A0A6L6XSB2_9ACTN|nr:MULTISPECIES: hypothetical protein [unclassified Nocardioides]MBA2955431.1 hypothetical protein [Nocardioides sp. CGMCC 1.13656]MVQ50281.1 hypothetical protein [Nocardioides sp. MAH-18]